MYELIQVGKNTFVINCPAKMGVYRLNAKGEVLLIDSGNDKEAGKKVQKILSANGWTLKAILNTHSNADHTGGNRLLSDRLGALPYSTSLEGAFIRHPILEPAFLYGGYPCRALRNKFLMAEPSPCAGLSDLALPAGMEVLPLPGHFLDMVGFRTPDNVCFLADCLSGENILEKYHITFVYDVAAYLDTLDAVGRLEGACFVPAHAEITEDIRPLAALNRAKVEEVCTTILSLCETPRMFEDLLASLFTRYGLTMDFNQYVLVGSTVRSYLSYLSDQGRLCYAFEDSRLLWKRMD